MKPHVEEEDEPGVYWVAVYLERLLYGGPEEGGWTFTTGTLVTDPAFYAEHFQGVAPSCHFSLFAARAACEALREGLASANEGRRSITSVLSTGAYAVEIFEDYLPKYFPESAPHYS